jgi:hypothetical protein
MKRQKLLKEITRRGAVFVRHGANHDIYENRRTNVSTQVPRHNELMNWSQRQLSNSFPDITSAGEILTAKAKKEGECKELK